MRENLVDAILEAADWKHWHKSQDGSRAHQNPNLEFGTQCLMAIPFISKDNFERLKQHWLKEIEPRIRIKKGLYRRTPKGYRHASMSLSRDELFGILICSYLFDGGKTAREIIEYVRKQPFRLYKSGRSAMKHKGKWYSGIVTWLGNKVDSEWLIFQKCLPWGSWTVLAGGLPLSKANKDKIAKDLMESETWHLLDVKLLLLEHMGRFKDWSKLGRHRLGNKYRGRYGDNPIYKTLFELRDGRSR